MIMLLRQSLISSMMLILTPIPVLAQTRQADSPRSKAPEKVKLESKLVTVTVTVVDRSSRFVTGLKKENFEVFDENVKQEIVHFTNDDAPLSIGIVYDVSGSMEGITKDTFAALDRFFEYSHADDEFFLVGFSDRAKLVQDFTVSPDKIISPAMLVAAKGFTALNDAVYISVEKVKQGRHPRKALLIISDGQENNSRYSFRDLRNIVGEADIQINALWISKDQFGRDTLREIAELGGGAAFTPAGTAEIMDVYAWLALQLRYQYVIGFYPTHTDSIAKRRRLRIRVNVPSGLGPVSVVHKKEYEAFSK